MASADTMPVVIACPHCGTRYQLPYGAIGTKGRTVACAHCGESWEAHAARPIPADTRFHTLAEEELDAKLIEEERRQREKLATAARRKEMAGKSAKVIALAGGRKDGTATDDDSLPDDVHRETLAELAATATGPALPDAGKAGQSDHRRLQSDFSRRQQSLYRTLPRAKARRLLRYSALAALAIVFGGGVLFREAVVSQFPQLAAPYAAIGLPVNVVGLQFANVRTLESMQDGTEVLVVDGSVQSVASRQVAVPPVVITLVDRNGRALYAWSVTPKLTDLRPGEAVAFETRLSGPPVGATSVTLSYGAGGGAGQPIAAGLNEGDGAGLAADAEQNGTGKDRGN